MYGLMRRSGSLDINSLGNLPGEYTLDVTGLRTGQNPDQRKIQYASSKVPLELWKEGQIRHSTIFPQIYVCINDKEQKTKRQQHR